MKKSFILHYDSLSVIDKMTDDQTGKLLRMMKSYHNGRDYICNDFAVELVFEQFKNQFDRDLIKYNNICERNSNNGKKWWRPQEPKEPSGLSGNPKKPRKADNDNDNDNDSKSDSINNNKINKKTNALSQPILNQWEQFEFFWKLFTHPRWTSKKDTLDFYKRSVEDEDIILNEVKYMNWCIRYWITDWKYIPACHKWMRDFVPTNPHIKEQNIKKIVYALMKDKNPEVAKQITNDFGKEIVDKYVKEYNKEFNTPILK